MKKLISTLAFALIFTSFSSGHTETDYSKTCKKMFEVSGAEDIYKEGVIQMMAIFKQQVPNEATGLWDDFEKEFLNTSLDDLFLMITPIYNKYLTQSDLEELIRFYETPIGKKLVKNNPAIMRDSMLIGQKWGMDINQKIIVSWTKKHNDSLIPSEHE